MTILQSRDSWAAGLIGRMLPLVIGLSCTPPTPPVFDNPKDPYAPTYQMSRPIIGTIGTSGNRQITIPFYSVDLYASFILIERRNGSAGDFSQVGSIPASQQSFSESVPPSGDPVFYYRARFKAPGGALSPYSISEQVTLP